MTGGYWGNVLLDVSEKTWETLWPRETSNKGFLRQAATTSGLKHFRIRSPGMAPARESYGCPSHQPPEETDLLLKQKLQRWFSGRAVFGTFPRGQWGNWAIPCPLFPPKKTMIDTDRYSLHNFYLKHSLLQLLGGGNISGTRVKLPWYSSPMWSRVLFLVVVLPEHCSYPFFLTEILEIPVVSPMVVSIYVSRTECVRVFGWCL